MAKNDQYFDETDPSEDKPRRTSSSGQRRGNSVKGIIIAASIVIIAAIIGSLFLITTIINTISEPLGDKSGSTTAPTSVSKVVTPDSQ